MPHPEPPRPPRRSRARLPFGARLALAVAIGLGVMVLCATVLLHHRLRDEQVRSDARITAAEARTFERVSAASADEAEALREIGELLRATSARPDVLRAMLVGGDFRVAAAGEGALVGRTERDRAVEDALIGRRTPGGAGSELSADPSDLEYVEPLTLRGRGYAYVVLRSPDALDARVRSADRTVLEGLLLGLLGGALAFVPLGGTLVREHRRALRNATLDGLTGLANARAFQADLLAAVGRARRHGEPVSLLAFDVDDFKFVNDRHGHRRGDALLREVAAILGDGRAGDRAFRVGGDEFMVLLPRTAEAGARTVAEKLLERLEAAGVRISAGVAELRADDDHEALRQQADAGLYEAKHRGGHRVVAFGEIADATSVTSEEAGLALRTMLDLGEAECLFQPIWDLRSGLLLGVEALARFPSAYGFDGPAEAFDVAQRIGRVHDLDVLCAREALRRASRELPDGALLFLNLAPQTLDRDGRGADWLLEEVQGAGLDAARVVVEVTERVGARGAAVAAAIEGLRANGLRVALDDVGSGSAGLDLLRRARPDFVKVDRSVVAVADADAGARATLLAIAAFSSQTDAYVIAEGVEDDATLALLHELDDAVRVHGAQGFGLGRPSAELPATLRPPASTGPAPAA